ncbi:nucleopolyhedrovirus P10 family protein [Streptomyces sp. NPDC021093]|uniref:nucleopolyhedrovirus P10 family protein n=1 Tax=Streptomyces sp. NPDC021093 TaxID=3365112 RepID=UPI0037B70C14
MSSTAPSAPDGGWTRAVRQRLGLGRLLPLGTRADGCWLAERAADAVLRRAGKDVAGVRLGALRVGPADPDGVREPPAVPPPPGALPPGPLRIEAEFEASPREPIPYAADRLRSALFSAAEDRLGLTVTEVDLRVTGLLGESPKAPRDVREKPDPTDPPGRQRQRDDAPGNGGSPEAVAARAATAVPGVARLTSVLGSPVRHDTAVPGHHVLMEVAVTGEHPAREVALAVRAAVADALPEHPSVAVLVTDVTYEKS